MSTPVVTRGWSLCTKAVTNPHHFVYGLIENSACEIIRLYFTTVA